MNEQTEQITEAVNEPLISLGATSIQISPLGVGTWAWGDKLYWGYGGDYGETDVRAAFDASVAAGINFFDTAEVYARGTSETLISRFRSEMNGETPIVIATKFFPWPYRWRKKNLLTALRKSNRRLGVQQVDLYQVHWPFRPRPIETWANALADAVDAGLTKAVGVSNYERDQMLRAHDVLSKRGIPLASNQVEFNLLQRNVESLLAACQERNITLIAYSPLGSGLLTGKYTADQPPRGFHRRQYDAVFVEKVQPLLNRMRSIGQRYGKTPAQVALNWVICKGAVPIPGAKTRRQAEENARALGWRLSEADVAALDNASQGF